MLQPRLIPCLLVDQHLHLTKTTRFTERRYLGDPLNAAFVYSGYEVDELMVLDIDASSAGRSISLEFVESLARFTRAPLAIGGGITKISEIHSLIAAGAERIILGSVLNRKFTFLNYAVENFGSSTVSVIINAKRETGGEVVGYFGKGNYSSAVPLIKLAKECEKSGAGEIILYDVDRDGTGEGFDLELVALLNDSLTIPLVTVGGCGCELHIEKLLNATPISGIGIGSFFVYAPNTREVLLSYPLVSSSLRSPLRSPSHNDE
jgi:cyclase